MNMYRQELKKIYKIQRKKDAEVGKYLNECLQKLLKQYKLPREKRDVVIIEDNMKIVDSIRKEKRFKDDFPSFAKFYHYVKENGLSIKELYDIIKEGE